jgi:hypothetical protein
MIIEAGMNKRKKSDGFKKKEAKVERCLREKKF